MQAGHGDKFLGAVGESPVMGTPVTRLGSMRKPASRRAAIPGPRATPAGERRDGAAAAMAALPAAQREILRLRLIDGLTADEVAERLSMPVSAVRVAQHRALEALRARLRA